MRGANLIGPNPEYHLRGIAKNRSKCSIDRIHTVSDLDAAVMALTEMGVVHVPVTAEKNLTVSLKVDSNIAFCHADIRNVARHVARWQV